MKKILYTITSNTDVELEEFVHTGNANITRTPRNATVFVTEPVVRARITNSRRSSTILHPKINLRNDLNSSIPQPNTSLPKSDEDETNSSDADVKTFMQRSKRGTSLMNQFGQRNTVGYEIDATEPATERSVSRTLSSTKNEKQGPGNVKQLNVDNYSRPESISASSTRGSFLNFKI